MSVKTFIGLVPALRPRLPFRVPSRKQAGCKNPVGEKREAAATSPQEFGPVPAATTNGRSVGVLKSKLRSSPVMILNGRPDAASMIGDTVQSEKNLLQKPPDKVPLWYTPLNTNRWR